MSMTQYAMPIIDFYLFTIKAVNVYVGSIIEFIG